jgi:hypothetical protein
MNSKAREALERSTTRLKGVADCYPEIRHLMQSQIEENDAALAEPLRNCDVGSLDEQITRFNAFCDSHMCRSSTNGCPLVDSRNCRLAWAQMPYEEEVIK